MSRKTVLVIVLFLTAIAYILYKLIFAGKSSVAGLKVVSTPVAGIYLDEKFIGKTPLDSRHPAGSFVIKLVPDDSQSSASVWQDKITLNPSTLTYIKKELGQSELTTSGEVITLDKIGDDEIEISVSSTPDAASVSIDGLEKGATPINIPISEGEHDITVTSTGFIGRTVRVKAVPDYRLNVDFQLSLSGEQLETPTPTPETDTQTGEGDQLSKPYVLVNETPTGFLRVRFDASISATEVGQLKPGDKVPYLDEKSGWIKIIYAEGKEGWISGRYADKVE